MSKVCGYTVIDPEGIEGPCDRPATGWRWYQNVEHEDCLERACDRHENEGGRRMHEAESKAVQLDRKLALIEVVVALWEAGATQMEKEAVDTPAVSRKEQAARAKLFTKAEVQRAHVEAIRDILNMSGTEGSVMPTGPDASWMGGWAKANGLDPNLVLADSVSIVGKYILYREAVQIMGGWTQRERMAPLVVGFEDFKRQGR